MEAGSSRNGTIREDQTESAGEERDRRSHEASE